MRLKDGLALVLFLILVGCGGGSGTDSGGSSTASGGSTANLIAISVTPTNSSDPADITGQFTAFGIYSDGTTKDITSQVTWTSSNSSVATIDSSGLATTVQQETQQSLQP